jgi:hypothetical protein
MKTALLVLLIGSALPAYEIETHASMTKAAFDLSVLSTDPTLFQRLGFDRLDKNYPFDSATLASCTTTGLLPSRDTYVDALGTWLPTPASAPDLGNVQFRCPTSFEKRAMLPRYSGRIPPTIAEGPTPQFRFESWLMRGVIREDDVKVGSYANPNDRPDADPWNDIDRPRNHFYSPITNSSDSAGTNSSLPWALGEANPFAAVSMPDPSRGNHFSYADAKRDMYLALTYKRPVIVAPSDTRDDANTRTALWASTLNALGHTIHLLQDTASPQHARGEPHNYVCHGAFSLINQDIQTRTYENFSNYRVTTLYNNQVRQAGGTDLFVATNSCEEKLWLSLFNEGISAAPSAAPFQGSTYPIPQFSLARKFFTTRAAGDPTSAATLPLPTLNARAGLADYSNRGFYTQDYQAGAYLSPPAATDPAFAVGPTNSVFVPGLGNLQLQSLYWKVPDPVQPMFADTGVDAQGRAPIVSTGQWGAIGLLGYNRTVLTLQNYTQMGDMLGPRAVAYSAGLINFFFRGKLDIEPIDQKVFAVMNQGDPHTVDADGYPRKPDGSIFGFEKIRLKVRNATDPIIESGTNANVPQTVGAGTLVAVARYHRNACYKPNMSGERIYRYSVAPQVLIDEPVCASGAPVRTNFQEISVSAPLTVAGSGDLPGGLGGTPPATIEKFFDFTGDPIPVNATDLFIQVVFRGQLGDEMDAIAVGNYDAREPTFAGVWNNTDYYYNATTWLPQNATFPQRGADDFRACAGVPSKFIYSYTSSGASGDVAMKFPVFGDVGSIRLALIFAQPATPTQQFAFRSTPVMNPPPSVLQRSAFTKGAQHQASQEIYAASGTGQLPVPTFCTQNPPLAGVNVWCFDPILQRRGLAFGHIAQPIYYASAAVFNDGPDVDSIPLPVFTAQTLRTAGILRFNVAGPLADCPLPPARQPAEVDQWIDTRERAWNMGIDPDR